VAKEQVATLRLPAGTGAISRVEAPLGFFAFATEGETADAVSLHVQPKDTSVRRSGAVQIFGANGNRLSVILPVTVGTAAERMPTPPSDFRTTFTLGSEIRTGLDALRAGDARLISLGKTTLRQAVLALCDQSGIPFLLRDVPDTPIELDTNTTPFLALEALCRNHGVGLDLSADGVWIIDRASNAGEVVGVTYTLGAAGPDAERERDLLAALQAIASLDCPRSLVKFDIVSNSVFVLTKRQQQAAVREYLAGVARIARPVSMDVRFAHSLAPLPSLVDVGWRPAELRDPSAEQLRSLPSGSITTLIARETDVDQGLLWAASEKRTGVTSWDTLPGGMRSSFTHATEASGRATSLELVPLRRENAGLVVVVSLRADAKVLFRETVLLPNGYVLMLGGLEQLPVELTGRARWGFHFEGALDRAYALLRQTPVKEMPVAFKAGKP
jgi:hypothetical protein